MMSVARLQMRAKLDLHVPPPRCDMTASPAPHGRCHGGQGSRSVRRPERAGRYEPASCAQPRAPRTLSASELFGDRKGLRQMAQLRTPTDDDVALAETMFAMFSLFKHVMIDAAQTCDVASPERARIVASLKSGPA